MQELERDTRGRTAGEVIGSVIGRAALILSLAAITSAVWLHPWLLLAGVGAVGGVGLLAYSLSKSDPLPILRRERVGLEREDHSRALLTPVLEVAPTIQDHPDIPAARPFAERIATERIASNSIQIRK